MISALPTLYLLVAAVFAAVIVADAPIAFAIAAAGLAGMLASEGLENTSRLLGSVFFSSASNYTLFVIPMYVLLGALMANAGIGEQIYRTVQRLVGRLPGGLAATAVGATALFSGISGSSAADTATFGRISVTEMGRHGYAKPYAAAVVAAAGTFASLIPPSVGIVIYCILASQSIGRMIIAAIVPGLLSALALTLFVVLRARMTTAEEGMGGQNTAAGTPAGAASAAGLRTSWLQDLRGALYAAIVFAIVIGGLYGGFFTPTEAGAMAAFAALLITLVARPASTTRRKVLGVSLRETSEVTSMIFLLLAGGATLSYFVASSGVTTQLVAWVTSLPFSPKVVVGFILLALLPLGMVLDGLSIMLLVVPLTAALVTELKFDGVWYGILVLKCIEIGLITPPVGMNVFIVSGLTGVETHKVFRHVRAFVVLDVLITLLLFLAPEIVLWLPAKMGF